MLDRYGDITWNHELQEALALGKPFVVLALESAWLRYTNLLHSITDPDALASTDDRQMVGLLRQLSSDYEITVAPFTYSTFKEKLRWALAALFQEGLRLIEQRTNRAILLETSHSSGPLTRDQITRLAAIATDEHEPNKLARKTAIRRIAAAGVTDSELALDVCRSAEQGVQRLGFDVLPQLLSLPLDESVVRELSQIAQATDDVGVPRRLVSSLAAMDPTMADVLLDAIDSVDEGVRRRAYEAVEEHWDEVLTAWGRARMAHFLDRCEATAPRRARWIDRLRRRKDDLGPE
jgi:hypothetical protein